MNTYYGVSQFHYGHEFRWIFEQSILSKEIYGGNEVPDEDFIDCHFPIGGSNSSATYINKLNSDEEIRDFLTAEADGPDYEDPMLIDIGEYLLTVDCDYDSCTKEFLDKFGLEAEALTKYDDREHRRTETIRMFEELQKAGYEGLDYGNPFYGRNRDMRFYEELCEIYKKKIGV